MNPLPILPLLIPLTTACLGLLCYRSIRVQQWLSIAGAVALVAAAVALLVRVDRGGILVVQLGGWRAPFGISFVADLFGSIMVVLAAVTGLATVIYSIDSVDRVRKRFLYHPLVHVLLAGVCGAFMTGDIFNLYVCFEILLLSSFVLLSLGSERGQLEGAIKYVTLNLFSSTIFLSAAGLLYKGVGTLNMADISVKVAEAAADGRADPMTTVAMLFMVAFGIKAAVFPLFFWLPASYHTPPFAVSALFAGLLTKVGVYAIARVFTLMFTHDTGFTHTVLLWVAALTMVSGVLGAASQTEFRRVLSFHIISQIGYMILGIALFTPLAVAGTVFYITHHIIVKANLFFVAGLAERIRGTSDLSRPGRVGVYAAYPLVCVLFLIPAMSLAGVPPLSGFWAKLLLIRASLDAGAYFYVAVALLVGIMTLFSMTKIWAEAFWKSPPEAGGKDLPSDGGDTPARMPRSMIAPVAGLAALTVLIGLAAQPVLALSIRAAEQMLNPGVYVQAVLGDGAGAAPAEGGTHP